MFVEALVATVIGALVLAGVGAFVLMCYAGYLRLTNSVPRQNERSPTQVMYFAGYVSAVGYLFVTVLFCCYLVGTIVMGVA